MLEWPIERPDMKDNDKPMHPHKWLLNELSNYLSEDEYETLLRDHSRVKRRHDLSSKLTATRTELHTYERAYANTSDDWNGFIKRAYAVKIEQRKARIAAIEKELAEL